MKVQLCPHSLSYSFFLLSFALSSATFAATPVRPIPGSEAGNGADVFDVGSALQVWDWMEFGRPYQPQGTPEYLWVEDRLQSLDKQLPHTVSFLRGLMTENAPLFFFVDPPLKPASNDPGASQLHLSYNRIQAAINRDRMIQINWGIWLDIIKPNPKDITPRSFLYLHEILWVANEYLSLSATDIRALTGILLSPASQHLSARTLGKMLLKFSKGELAAAISRDLPPEDRVARPELKTTYTSCFVTPITTQKYFSDTNGSISLGFDFVRTLYGRNRFGVHTELARRTIISETSTCSPIELSQLNEVFEELEKLVKSGVCPETSLTVPNATSEKVPSNKRKRFFTRRKNG